MCLRKSDIQNSDRRQGLPQTDDTHNISNLSVHSLKYGEGIVGTVAESQKLVNIVDADKG
jgi:signal transduction protein with GAF and PtsI domain